MDEEKLKAIEKRHEHPHKGGFIGRMQIKDDIPALLKEVKTLKAELELMSGITKRFIEARDLRGAFLQFLADEINEGLTSNMTVKVDDDNKIHIKMRGDDQEDLDPTQRK